MRTLFFVGALAVAFLVGLFINRLADPIAMQVSAGDALNALVTLLVGLFIQNALRGRAEIERIPIEAMARTCLLIESRIARCLDLAVTNPDRGELLQHLRLLSNDLRWLETFCAGINVVAEESEDLVQEYFQFKANLTAQREVAVAAASRCAGNLRMLCIRLQVRLSREVLQGKAEVWHRGRR